MSNLSVQVYQDVLDRVADALRHPDKEFPDAAMTRTLQEIFQADFAGAGQIDLVGTASRRWSSSPAPLPAEPGEFHRYAVSHPISLAYRRVGEPVPLRLSDVAAAGHRTRPFGASGMPHVMTIPLAISPRRQTAIGLMRGGRDFSRHDLEFARQLQPVLSGLHATVKGLVGESRPNPPGASTVPVSTRELAVFTLMADGLTAASIGTRLGISPRTVSKHIESIYRKLGAHDRVSAVMRGLELGILPVQAGRARR